MCTWIRGTMWRNRASVSCACPGSRHSSSTLSFSFLPSSVVLVCVIRCRPEPNNWEDESLSAAQAKLKEPRHNKSHLSCLSYLPDERGGEGGVLIHDTMEGRVGSVLNSPTTLDGHVGQLTEVSSPEDKTW